MRKRTKIGKKPRKVIRQHAGTIVNGLYVDGALELLTIIGNIQPATESNRMFYLPEGERSKEAIWFSMHERIFMAQSGDTTDLIKPDLIDYDDALWEVKGSKYFANETLAHTEGVAIRLTESQRKRIIEVSTWLNND